MKLVIFGANGPTGRQATEQAIAEGHTVTAVTRRPEAFPLRDPQLRVVGADVLDPAAVEHTVAGQEAVISTLGVSYSRNPVTVYSGGDIPDHSYDAAGEVTEAVIVLVEV